MRPEEAIKIIEAAKAECEWNAPLEFQEAFDAAIDALEKQIPKQDVPDTNVGDIISRQAALKICRRYWHPKFNPIMEEIEKLPPVQPEIIHCRDCKWYNGEINQCNAQICASMRGEDFCSRAERREE